MPRPGGPRGFEKSKDFKGSMIRLIKNLSPWKFIMIMALGLAMISAILALVAPNKLSDFADTISEGLIPNSEMIETVSVEISKNIISSVTPNKIDSLFTSVELTSSEAKNISDIFYKMKDVTREEAFVLILDLPEKVLNYLIDDIKVDGVKITSSEQIEVLRLMSEMGNEAGTQKALSLIDKLPESVYSLVRPTINMDKIWKLVTFMATLYIVSALFNYIQSFSLATVSNRFANKLRDSISRKINKLPLKYFDMHENGDVLSRVTNDVDTVAMNLNNSLATLVTSITLFLGSIIMMFVTNWIMAFTAIISTILGFLLMFTILSKSQKYFNKRQEALGKMNGYIEEMYSGHNVVKVYNGTKKAFLEFENLNKNLYEANLSLIHI